MNSALGQEFIYFCEQEQLQNIQLLDKKHTMYSGVYNTVKICYLFYTLTFLCPVLLLFGQRRYRQGAFMEPFFIIRCYIFSFFPRRVVVGVKEPVYYFQPFPFGLLFSLNVS